jgi:hypothetical protein
MTCFFLFSVHELSFHFFFLVNPYIIPFYVVLVLYLIFFCAYVTLCFFLFVKFSFLYLFDLKSFFLFNKNDKLIYKYRKQKENMFLCFQLLDQYTFVVVTHNPFLLLLFFFIWLIICPLLFFRWIGDDKESFINK